MSMGSYPDAHTVCVWYFIETRTLAMGNIYPFLQSLILLMLPLILLPTSFAQLRRDYYKNTCPNVESIVRAVVQEKYRETQGITAPATLRLFFHDCFVQGCDASVMLAVSNNTAEKDHPANLSLAGDGFDTVNKAKAAVDAVSGCKNKVSCADILAMAARDAVALTGGPSYAVEMGRLDGRISSKAIVENHLPRADFNLNQLNTMFASHGLTQIDMIALSGAHTIGSSHCDQFSERIHNFSKKHQIDPTLNPDFASQLKNTCNLNPRPMVSLDLVTRLQFDNNYFKNLQQGKGLLTADQILYTDERSRKYVNLFASNRTAFEHAFVAAMTKLGRIGVKTGNQGEIRHDCASVN